MSVLDTLDHLLFRFNSWLVMMDSQGSSSSNSSQGSQDSGMTIMDENRQEILYFAYGSNLSTAQMLERCPYSVPVGLGHLKGWKWLINSRGYANIVQQQQQQPGEGSGSSHSSSSFSSSSIMLSKRDNDHDHGHDNGVYGLLYLLPPQDEDKLDRFEGVPWAYEKMHLEVQYVRDVRGRDAARELQRVTVLAYVDRKRTREAKPKEEYVGRMERGIRDAVENWGLDEGYANRVMRRFWR